mgnify:CR=1 FL=1
MVDLRKQFMQEFRKLNDTNIFITMDVGFNFIEEIEKEQPQKFRNLGVRERGAMIYAAGMGLQGITPWIYSMINFVTIRCHEEIRNAVCMHNSNVKILGVKGSEKYKFLGFSHNLLYETEEISFLSQLPNMQVYVPETENKFIEIMEFESKRKGPAYIRL